MRQSQKQERASWQRPALSAESSSVSLGFGGRWGKGRKHCAYQAPSGCSLCVFIIKKGCKVAMKIQMKS